MADYAHIVSHYLKEPVRMVNSFLGMFIKKYEDQLDEKGRKYIDFAQGGATRMNKLIEELLNFSKNARVTGSFVPVDLNHTLEQVLKDIDYQVKEKNAEILVQKGLPTIEGIESALIQLFFNLINNSLKFTPNERNPKINISGEETDTSFVLKIKDNGIGIPDNELDHIFTIFRRGQTKEEFSGTGIGLAIVKKIITVHNAGIEVKSEVNRGSEFIIYFPR